MKIITHPTITLVARTQFLGHPNYLIPDDGDDAVKLGAFSAKGCYDSFSRTGRDNIANQTEVLGHRHGSVLEHIHLSMFIEGISRALSLEFNRHRNLAISQRSTRYTKEEDSAIVLEPYYAELFKKYDMRWEENLPEYAARGLWMSGNESAMKKILDSYTPSNIPEGKEFDMIFGFLTQATNAIHSYGEEVESLISMNPNNLSGFDLRKWARGKARNILPHALETRATYTASVREWRWIIESRSNKHAEPEIRRLAQLLLHTLKSSVDLYFNDFEVSEIYDGIPVYTPQYSKV